MRDTPRFHHIPADPANLAHQLGLQASAPVTIDDLLRAAQHLGGLQAKLTRITADRSASQVANASASPLQGPCSPTRAS